MDLEGAVISAWQATADELPGVLAILDRHRAEPLDDAMAWAMTTSTVKEHQLLAVMAGRSSARDARAARAGEQIANRARATRRSRPPPSRTASTSLVDRLKAVLHAA